MAVMIKLTITGLGEMRRRRVIRITTMTVMMRTVRRMKSVLS